MPSVRCETCGKEFNRKQSAINKVKHHYCSEPCSNIGKKKPNPTQKCPLCGKEFTITNRVTNRIHCSYECAHNSQKNRTDISCATCGKIFPVSEGRHKKGAKYCSTECLNIARSKNEVIKVKKESTLVDRTCQTCGKQFKAKRAEVGYGGGKFCCHECYHHSLTLVNGKEHFLYKERIQISCLHCGKEIDVIPSNYGRAKFCSRSCASAWLIGHIQKPTKPESAVELILRELGATYEREKGIGPYSCDFYVKPANLVIEVDGVYWHSLPENIARDKRKSTFLLNHGYKLLRITDTEINENPCSCATKIANAIAE